MNKHFFISDESFNSQFWSIAFPNSQTVTSTSLTTEISSDAFVWVLAGTNNWLEMITFYTSKGCKVVAMSRKLNIDELRDALEAGARGYIDALSKAETLHQVAISISANAMWLPAPLVSKMIHTFSTIIKQQELTKVDLSTLTEREIDVVEMILQGSTNKVIAKHLNITERTVKAHLSSIFNKLGARDRMHLMLLVRGY